MSKLSCVIVDDDLVSRKILKKQLEQLPQVNLLHEFNSPIDAQTFLLQNAIDLLFLDVEMPEMSGFDLLEGLPKKPIVVLITSKSEYALDGFEYEVEDFLVKPVTLARLSKAVTKVEYKYLANLSVENTPTNREVFFKVDGSLLKVNLNDLIYMQAMADYVNIYLKSDDFGMRKVTTHGTMKEMETVVSSKKFIRIHRSYILNIAYAQNVSRDRVMLDKGIELPIGNTYKEGFVSAFENNYTKI